VGVDLRNYRCWSM